MKIHKIFVSINAIDFGTMSDWWSTLLDRSWDREPMPSCHEWDLTPSVLFQVLDNPEGGEDKATVTLHVTDLDAERARLISQGIVIPGPEKVEGFTTLRYLSFEDPEGNRVGMLDGE